jgi:hypothetical protein
LPARLGWRVVDIPCGGVREGVSARHAHRTARLPLLVELIQGLQAMPTFHVIYDPTDKLRVDPGLPNALKLQVATLRVADVPDGDPEFDAEIVRQLTALLLKNMTV